MRLSLDLILLHHIISDYTIGPVETDVQFSKRGVGRIEGKEDVPFTRNLGEGDVGINFLYSTFLPDPRYLTN